MGIPGLDDLPRHRCRYLGAGNPGRSRPWIRRRGRIRGGTVRAGHLFAGTAQPSPGAAPCRGQRLTGADHGPFTLAVGPDAHQDQPLPSMPQLRREGPDAGRSKEGGLLAKRIRTKARPQAGAPRSESADLRVPIGVENSATSSRRLSDLALCVYVKRLRSNCRCDVSTLAESWKIMHSCAYMGPGATPSIRQIRALVG